MSQTLQIGIKRGLVFCLLSASLLLENTQITFSTMRMLCQISWILFVSPFFHFFLVDLRLFHVTSSTTYNSARKSKEVKIGINWQLVWFVKCWRTDECLCLQWSLEIRYAFFSKHCDYFVRVTWQSDLRPAVSDVTNPFDEGLFLN